MYYDWKHFNCKYRIEPKAEVVENDITYAVYVQTTANFQVKSRAKKTGEQTKEICDAYGSYLPMPKNKNELNDLIAKHGKFFTGKCSLNLFVFSLTI